MKIETIILPIIILVLLSTSAFAAPLDPQSLAKDEYTLSSFYDLLVTDLTSNERVVSSVEGKMWVPWYERADVCSEQHLKRDQACRVDGEITFDRNCMVTDEFSQVGVLVAMGKDQQKFEEFYNTVIEIKSSFGDIPAWRVFRDGANIEACKQGVNSNCDTASDATARIIIALYTASENPHFSDHQRKDVYRTLATKLSEDLLEFETLQTCLDSTVTTKKVCHWLAAGAQAAKAGFSATDFGYTGYYADAIIAMLQACSITQDGKYCQAATDFSLNYLEAAKFNGITFSTPPGRSYRWNVRDNIPHAECTNTCSPEMWDGFDAPRALGMCQALYYANKIEYDMPELQNYCDVWMKEYLGNPFVVPIQFYPTGQPASLPQSGYYAQGLQSLALIGSDSTYLLYVTLTSALSHYQPSKKVWDDHACFGVYTQAFPMRALGTAIGRDAHSFGDVQEVEMPSFPRLAPPPPENLQIEPPPAAIPERPKETIVELLETSCEPVSLCRVQRDTTIGECRTITHELNGESLRIQVCAKDEGHYELYRKAFPNNIVFNACVGEICIDNLRGFASTRGESAPKSTPQALEQKRVDQLAFRCSAPSKSCSIQKDETDGDCRTIEGSIQNQFLKVLVCKKGSNKFEIYRQEAPGFEFQACIEDVCVDNMRGFNEYYS